MLIIIILTITIIILIINNHHKNLSIHNFCLSSDFYKRRNQTNKNYHIDFIK